MARRGWARSVTYAILSAAGVAAAQAGLGYGLGVLSWTRVAGITGTAVTESGTWSSSLAWTTLIAATSVVAGAIVGDRVAGRTDGGSLTRVARRLIVALAAGIGGVLSLPLVMVPSTAAQVPGTFAPQLLVGVYAVAGLVLGVVVALAALTARAIAANVITTTVWLWVLAAIVIVDRSVFGRPYSYVPPSVWKFTEHGPTWGSVYLPGAMLMLGAALLIGGLAAFPSAGRGARRFGIAISGGVGPLIIAIAYRLAEPDPKDTPFEQISAAIISPYLIAAGLAGSVLVAAVGGVPGSSKRRRRRATHDPSAPPPSDVDEPEEEEASGTAQTPAGRTVSGVASVPAASRARPGEYGGVYYSVSR
jgi:hypothetical protein